MNYFFYIQSVYFLNVINHFEGLRQVGGRIVNFCPNGRKIYEREIYVFYGHMKFGNFHLSMDSEKVCILEHAILFLLIFSINFRYSCHKIAHFSCSLAQGKHIVRGHACPGQVLAACQCEGGRCSGMGAAGKAIMNCMLCCGT